MSQYVGAAEAARILGCDRATISRFARQGQLPTLEKLPGSTGARMFLRRDVEQLRDSRKAS